MKRIDLTVAKPFVNLVVAYGTGRIVGDIVVNNTAPKNKADEIAIRGAGYVIGSMLAEKTQEYTSAKLDDFEAWCNAKIAESR